MSNVLLKYIDHIIIKLEIVFKNLLTLERKWNTA